MKLIFLFLSIFLNIILIKFSFGQEKENSDSLEVFENGIDTIAIMPIFPGGDQELLEFIWKNIKYPQYAKDNLIQGKVLVQFIVNEKGIVENVHIVKGVNLYLDNEAKRVIESLPAWSPGMQKGKAVKVKFTIPINFSLTGIEDSKSKWKSRVNTFLINGRLVTFYYILPVNINFN